MKRVSIGSWAYTIGPYADKPVDFETVCSKLQELGFDGVELGGFPPHPNPDDLPGREQLVRRCAESVRRPRHGVQRPRGQPLGPTPDRLRRPGALHRRVHEELRILRATWGSRASASTRCSRRRSSGRSTTTPPSSASSEPGAAASTIAKDHGLYVTWEFEPGFAFNKPSDIQRVLDAIDDPAFGVLYDTSHGHMVSVVGARHPGEKETLPGGQVELDRASLADASTTST